MTTFIGPAVTAKANPGIAVDADQHPTASAEHGHGIF